MTLAQWAILRCVFSGRGADTLREWQASLASRLYDEPPSRLPTGAPLPHYTVQETKPPVQHTPPVAQELAAMDRNAREWLKRRGYR